MMKLGTIFLVLLLFVVAQAAFAAGGGGHDGVPVKTVSFQFINFFAFVALLTFVLRKKIAAFYAQRLVDFKEQFEKARKRKEEAEKKNSKIKTKIKVISETEDQQVQKAQSDANTMKAKLLSDAQTQAEQIKADAHKMSSLEYYKANQELRQELIDQVVDGSKNKLQSDINDNDQTALRDKFLENVQAVQ